MLNQTFGLTPEMAHKAYGGDRLNAVADARKAYDPEGRLLNDYFRVLLS
jgi:hypothetical protein